MFCYSVWTGGRYVKLVALLYSEWSFTKKPRNFLYSLLLKEVHQKMFHIWCKIWKLCVESECTGWKDTLNLAGFFLLLIYTGFSLTAFWCRKSIDKHFDFCYNVSSLLCTAFLASSGKAIPGVIWINPPPFFYQDFYPNCLTKILRAPMRRKHTMYFGWESRLIKLPLIISITYFQKYFKLLRSLVIVILRLDIK